MLLIIFYLALFVAQLIGIIVSARQHNTGWVTLYVAMFVVEIAAIAAYRFLRNRASDGGSRPEKQEK